jgi:hypothetical protein
MKKLFLLLAFTGIVGASSASSILTFTHPAARFTDDKKTDDKKKSCCKKGKEGEAKQCSGDKKKECCKSKKEATDKKETATKK